MTEHTPEQLALARKCAAQYWQTGEESDESAARRILSGEWDDQAYVQAALAAIVETTERTVRMVEQQQQVFLSPEYATGQPMSSHQERFACGQIADALRTYAHIKDPSHADG